MVSAEETAGASKRIVPFDRVTIVGVGLMGASLGLALRQRRLTGEVVGVGRNRANLEVALEKGAIDRYTTHLAQGVHGADCVVIGAPVGAIPSLLESLAPLVRPEALVTDLGSAKTHIVAVGDRSLGPRFVGGHPMAGSEKSGAEAARAGLYEGAAWPIVRSEPFEFSEDPYAARLAGLVTSVGARPIPMGALIHDRLVALVSHLPHLLSFAFAQTVRSDDEAQRAQEIAAGSYRDLMRVSGSDPGLWRDILLENRDAVLHALAAYETRLRALRDSVSTGDGTALLRELQYLAPS